MNILFLTILSVSDVRERGIYTDLMREFRDNGHDIYIVCPTERRYKRPTSIRRQEGITLLNVKTFNLQKTNIIEKGIGTLALEHQFLTAIKKHLSDVRFDLVIYSTPPITFTKVIRYIKKRDKAHSYLLLKDIFPQNAVDISMMKENSFIHRFFRKKESDLYNASDYIGCMSPANVAYVLSHNEGVRESHIEVCPNSVAVSDSTLSLNEKEKIRRKHSIPKEATIFIYGGNLGKPQGLDFLLNVLEANNEKNDRYFIIVGSGTEYPKIKKWFETHHPKNAVLLQGLPKQEYDRLVQSCDVGLIFLDPRFTIPNYPSRLLSYMEYKMPVLMATDVNTDIGTMAEKNGYGLWCENGDLGKFNELLDTLTANRDLRYQMGENGYKFLLENYTVKHTYGVIMRHFE